jgi:hypothetical protein
MTRRTESLTPDEILTNYSPRLISILASLVGAPKPICQATIQLLPFGSRAALEATGVAQTGPEVDQAGHRGLVLTPLAFEVIEAAAAMLDRPTPAASTDVDWDARANRALARHPDGQK